ISQRSGRLAKRGVRDMDAQRPKSSRSLIEPQTVMVRPLLLKPQWMNGLSERLLVSHYENNYGGALRRLNAIRARLAFLDWERALVFRDQQPQARRADGFG